MNEINQKLLKTQQDWQTKSYNDVLKGNEGSISCAFSCGVSNKYLESDKKIMIVGQEAIGLTCKYDVWDLPNMQEWYIKYFERQLRICKHGDISWNRSAFWQFMRKLNDEGYFPCWNNIEKVIRYKYGVAFDNHKFEKTDNGAEQEVFHVYENEREALNRPCLDGKTLLQKEIEIAQPDIVVFVVGPHNPYYNAMELAFNLDENQLKDYYPTNERYITEVSDVLGLNIPTYWTYHPQFLSRKKYFDDVIKFIIKK